MLHKCNIRTIPSCVTAKPPPTKKTYYPDIGKEQNFLQYILRCGGTSTNSAGVVLSWVLNKHAYAFLEHDTALIHLFQFIIFTTVLSQRFEHILSDMILRNGQHAVAYFGVKIAWFMDICVSGASRGRKQVIGPQAKNKLSVEHHDLIVILSKFKDIIMFKANKMLESEKTLRIETAGRCRFNSKFMGWFYAIKKINDRPDIIALIDVIPNDIGMEWETTDNKKTSRGVGKTRID